MSHPVLTTSARRWFAAFVLVLGLVTTSRIAEAHPQAERVKTTVRATGHAVVWKGNAQVAEAQASAAAYRLALEKVATSLGGPKAGEDVLIDQLLYARAARFVTHSTLAARRLHGVRLDLDLDVEIEVEAVQSVLSSRAPRPPRPVNRAALAGSMWVCRPQCAGASAGSSVL